MIGHRDIILINTFVCVALYFVFENAAWKPKVAFMSTLPFLGMATIATGSVCLGALKSEHSRKEQLVDRISKTSAMEMPLYASAALITLFFCMKSVSKQLINALLSVYFTTIGVFSVNSFVLFLTGRNPAIITGLLALSLSLFHFFIPHWVTNNLLGISFCVASIGETHVVETQTGLILLGGLFLYDILWVFGSNVMLEVALNIEGPVKLIIPKAIESSGANYNLLGLGDVIIPGAYIALMHRIDQDSGRKGISTHFFRVSLIGYIFGLFFTFLAVITLKSGQPALLYIVPVVILTSGAYATFIGQLNHWIWYKESHEETKHPIFHDRCRSPVQSMIATLRYIVLDYPKQELFGL